MTMHATSAVPRRENLPRASLTTLEVVVACIVGATALAKITLQGTALTIVGDGIFLCAIFLLRSKTALFMLLACSAIAIPSVPGVDKVLGGPFYVELAALALAARVWLSTGLSINFSIPRSIILVLTTYSLLFVVSVARGGALSNHLVTVRYVMLLFVIVITVRAWVLRSDLRSDFIEELVCRSLRAALVIYVVIYAAQFGFVDAYDRVFFSSSGEREGTRVAYQIQNYIPILALTLLFVGTARGEVKQRLGLFYANIKWQIWLIAALFAMLATGARMALMQWVAIALVFVFFRSFRALIGVSVAGFISVLMINLPIFSGVLERLADIGEVDLFFSNLMTRMLPAVLAIGDMQGADFLIGKGFDYKFFVPWFDTRADDFEPYSTFIDHLWATVFVQAGLIGCVAVLAVFAGGAKFYLRHSRALGGLPTIRFFVLFSLAYLHGFANIVYAKDFYVFMAIVIGSLVAFRSQETRSVVAKLTRRGAPD